MSDDEGKVDMNIAINTQMTSDNLRKMGFDEAADVMHDQAHWAAGQAIEHGWKEQPQQPDVSAEHQTSMSPITKDEWDRDVEYTKRVEEVRRSLGEGPEQHADPHVQREPMQEGEGPPPIFD